VDPLTGAVVLDFQAKFLAQLGNRPPTELDINTRLTSEPAEACGVHKEGRRLVDGECM